MPLGNVTFNDLVVEALTRFPDREAFVDGDRRASYRQSAACISKVMATLIGRGVGPCSGIVALSPNRPESGDLGRCDDAGFVYLVDRTKDMIISGGLDIYAREVEDVLTSAPSVAAAAVVGVPDPRWGEAVTAFVVARPGATVQPDELIALVRDKKGAHQAPKSIEVIDALPLTTVGKIDKKVLRARHRGDG